MPDAPTLDDVRAWLNESAGYCDEIATDGSARTAQFYRAALAALDDAERLEKLRRIAIDGVVELIDENAYRGSVTVTFKVSRVEVDALLERPDALFARRFNSVVDAARREGA